MVAYKLRANTDQFRPMNNRKGKAIGPYARNVNRADSCMGSTPESHNACARSLRHCADKRIVSVQNNSTGSWQCLHEHPLLHRYGLAATEVDIVVGTYSCHQSDGGLYDSNTASHYSRFMT